LLKSSHKHGKENQDFKSMHLKSLIWWPLQQKGYAQKKTACPLKALPVPRAQKKNRVSLEGFSSAAVFFCAALCAFPKRSKGPHTRQEGVAGVVQKPRKAFLRE